MSNQLEAAMIRAHVATLRRVAGNYPGVFSLLAAYEQLAAALELKPAVLK